jgi:hypothetical protein
MTTYGIVVEGNYDKVALSEIIRKCISNDIEILPYICASKDSLISKFPGFLESFRYAKQGSNVDKVLVIRDADNKNPDELMEKMTKKIAGRTYPFGVKFVIIVQELETWLLSDETAISKVTQSRSGRTVSRINDTLESIVQPKERLYKILSDARVPYTEAVAREIAKESDLNKIEYRCPRFKEFRQTVIDC